jgi:hypothetical protein
MGDLHQQKKPGNCGYLQLYKGSQSTPWKQVIFTQQKMADKNRVKSVIKGVIFT